MEECSVLLDGNVLAEVVTQAAHERRHREENPLPFRLSANVPLAPGAPAAAPPELLVPHSLGEKPRLSHQLIWPLPALKHSFAACRNERCFNSHLNIILIPGVLML